MNIKENLAFIKNTLPDHVTLVAVSKTKPLLNFDQEIVVANQFTNHSVHRSM